MVEVTLNKSLDYLKNLKLGDAAYNSKIQKLYMQIYESKKLIVEIENFADEYTFENQSECGFRSIIKVYLIAVSKALAACDRPSWIWRLLFFFSHRQQLIKLQIHCDILDNFIKILRNLHVIHARSNEVGNLIFDEGIFDNSFQKFYNEIKLSSFYGNEAGFYHNSPSKLQSRFFIVSVLCFADFYYSGKHLLIRLLKVPIDMLKYTINPLICGQRAEEVIRNVDIDFMKVGMLSFASRISCFIQNFLNHSFLAVNKIIKITPEPLEIRSLKDDNLTTIQVPKSHFKTRPIPCRLLSSTKRFGMVGENSKREASKYLIIHVHGGGFYTHTSQSHEIYVRSWAHNLDVPILSIEYSLAPKAPFPRAIEEIFYVYCWVLKTGGKLLGTTAENVIFVGDSAGANLIVAVLIKCIEMGIQRPKGIFTIYGLFVANYAAIPSRLLGLFDIFLTYSMMLRIIKTYAGHFKPQNLVKNGKIPRALENEFSDEIPKNYLMTPILAPNEILKQFPKIRMLTTDLDPCLDENIEMAKKLKAENVDVKLDTIEGLVHGFLHLRRLDGKAHEGSMKCVQHMKELLELKSEVKKTKIS